MFLFPNPVDENLSFFINQFVISFLEMKTDELEECKDDKLETETILLELFPEWKAKNEPYNCILLLNEILNNFKDRYSHPMDIIREYVIQRIICKVDEEKSEYETDFLYVYYHDYTKDELVKRARNYLQNDDSEGYDNDFKNETDDEILNFVIDSDSLSDCFLDSDCLAFDSLIDTEGGKNFMKSMNNLDEIPLEFAPLLPPDISKEILSRDNLLSSFIQGFKEAIECSTYRITGIESFKEKDFQLLFELFCKGYFHESTFGKDVFREPEFGNGMSDFCLKINYENVIFELKMANKEKILQALTSQLPEYMRRTGSKIGFCLAFTDKPIVDENLFYEAIQKVSKQDFLIGLVFIDYSPKETPSNLKAQI
jgi:hypothetical protein